MWKCRNRQATAKYFWIFTLGNSEHTDIAWNTFESQGVYQDILLIPVQTVKSVKMSHIIHLYWSKSSQNSTLTSELH